MRKLNESITLDFTCHNAGTGQVSDADFLPTCQVFEDTTDIPIITPVVTRRVGQTGDYRLTFITSPANGFEIGKSYNVIVEATVGGVTAKAELESFNLEAVPVTFQV
jgi:hypothetical protein